MLNKPLIRPYFILISGGGYVRGGWLTSHNKIDFKGQVAGGENHVITPRDPGSPNVSG